MTLTTTMEMPVLDDDGNETGEYIKREAEIEVSYTPAVPARIRWRDDDHPGESDEVEVLSAIFTDDASDAPVTGNEDWLLDLVREECDREREDEAERRAEARRERWEDRDD